MSQFEPFFPQLSLVKVALHVTPCIELKSCVTLSCIKLILLTFCRNQSEHAVWFGAVFPTVLMGFQKWTDVDNLAFMAVLFTS